MVIAKGKHSSDIHKRVRDSLMVSVAYTSALSGSPHLPLARQPSRAVGPLRVGLVADSAILVYPFLGRD